MIKTITIFAIMGSLLITPNCLQSQTHKSVKNVGEHEIFYYTFEPGEYVADGEGYHVNNYQFIEFDTTGLWQIGQPQKAEWDSAYRGKYVFMTDTLNMLSQPATASFTFKFERPWYSNCIMMWNIYLTHLYDLPINKAGIYIEVSYTHGLNWLQLIDDSLPCFQSGTNCSTPDIPDYLLEHKIGNYYAASGVKDWWYNETDYLIKSFDTDTSAAKIISVWLRFTYTNTDTISHKGWMIDDLDISIFHGCEFLSVNEKGSPVANLFPNPVVGQSVINFENLNRQEWQLNVYNLMGKLVVSEQTCNEYFLVNKTQFANGSYVYQLTSNNKTMATGKFLVE